MTPNVPALKRTQLSLVLGGTLLIAGGTMMISTEPALPYSASQAEYEYQELLVEMDSDLENIYGDTPSDEMGFLDFMDQQDVTSA